MNTERLVQLLEQVLDAEAKHSIQAKLQAVNQALSQLASQPANQDFQKALVSAVEALDAATREAEAAFSPAVLERLEELGAAEFFADALVGNVRQSVGENAMTPAVAQQAVADLLGRRDQYLKNARTTVEGLTTLGFAAQEMNEGDAEIGFLLPRPLFDNQLGPLIDELRAVKRIIRAFSELATGSAEPIEVREISSSDPFFFFG